jgi:hypothetical protein
MGAEMPKNKEKEPNVATLVGHVQGNAVGPHRFADPVRLFADPDPGPDEVSFHEPNTDAKYYKTGYYFKHRNDIQPFPRPMPDPPRIDLAQLLGPNLLQPIVESRSLTFHSVGDTGASDSGLISSEHLVADSMSEEVTRGGVTGPAFLFHLGDVVYSFGESQYYYDQFYEPFRRYDRPIFALAGNHDGAVYGPNVNTPVAPTLTAFLRNFCASSPGPSPDAVSVARTTMTQPGVYFTLDTPCLSIIGLYSNVLEHPGVVSSQGGHFSLPDDQLSFLSAELARLKPEREAMTRAVILAVHHPPVSFDGTNGSSPLMANEIDEVCAKVDLWPDMVLSGHAHLYQRFSRQIKGRTIPYLVAGSGGHLMHQPRAGLPKAPKDYGNYRLEVDPIAELGYLTITVDLSDKGHSISSTFNSQAERPTNDSFVLNLDTGAVT